MMIDQCSLTNYMTFNNTKSTVFDSVKSDQQLNTLTGIPKFQLLDFLKKFTEKVEMLRGFRNNENVGETSNFSNFYDCKNELAISKCRNIFQHIVCFCEIAFPRLSSETYKYIIRCRALAK